jgi:hypothetical protein
MLPKDEIKYGTIAEVQLGHSVLLSLRPEQEVVLTGPHRFAIPFHYLAILGEPEVVNEVECVKVEWGGETLYADYNDLRYGTANIAKA